LEVDGFGVPRIIRPSKSYQRIPESQRGRRRMTSSLGTFGCRNEEFDEGNRATGIETGFTSEFRRFAEEFTRLEAAVDRGTGPLGVHRNRVARVL